MGEDTQDCILGYIQPSLRDWFVLSKSYPGLASWATLRRPCGTEFGDGVLTHPLQPVRKLTRIDGLLEAPEGCLQSSTGFA
jgi:hypothetical protein